MTEKPVARITFTCGEKNYSYRAIINNQKISHVGIRENHSKDSMIPEVIMSYETFWMQLKATREKCIADGMPYDIKQKRLPIFSKLSETIRIFNP